jgi:hypothetical protein
MDEFTVEIVSADVEKFEGVSKKNGNKFLIERQFGYVRLPGEQYPVKIKIPVKNHASYPPGVYRIAPASFAVNSYGEFGVRDLVLSPATIAKSSVRAAS